MTFAACLFSVPSSGRDAAPSGLPFVLSHAVSGVSHGGLADGVSLGKAGVHETPSGVPDTFLIARKPSVASSVAAGLTVVVTGRLDPRMNSASIGHGTRS